MQDIFISDLFQRIGWGILHSLWQITLLGAFYFFVQRTVPLRFARMRYCIGFAILSAMLIVPCCTIFLVEPLRLTALKTPAAISEMPSPEISAVETTVVTEPREPEPIEKPSTFERFLAFVQKKNVESQVPVENALPENEPEISAAPIIADEAMVEDFAEKTGQTKIAKVDTSSDGNISATIGLLIPFLPILGVIWGCGVLFLSVRLVRDWFSLQSLRRNSMPIIDGPWSQRLQSLCIKLGIKRVVSLANSRGIDSPMLIGAFKPLILLPLSMTTGFTPEEIEAIIAHELGHIRRYDYVANLLQVVIETLLFYHPLVWWVSRSVRFDREYVCDDFVVHQTGTTRVFYAQTLAHLEQFRQSLYGEKEMKRILSTPAAAAKPLLKRVQRILGMKTQADRSADWLAGLLLLGFLAAVPVFLIAGENASENQADNNQQVAENSAVITVTETAQPAAYGNAMHVHVPHDHAHVENANPMSTVVINGEVCGIDPAAANNNCPPTVTLSAVVCNDPMASSPGNPGAATPVDKRAASSPLISQPPQGQQSRRVLRGYSLKKIAPLFANSPNQTPPHGMTGGMSGSGGYGGGQPYGYYAGGGTQSTSIVMQFITSEIPEARVTALFQRNAILVSCTDEEHKRVRAVLEELEKACQEIIAQESADNATGTTADQRPRIIEDRLSINTGGPMRGQRSALSRGPDPRAKIVAEMVEVTVMEQRTVKNLDGTETTQSVPVKRYETRHRQILEGGLATPKPDNTTTSGGDNELKPSQDFATPQPVYHTKSAVKAIPADQPDFIAESQPVERRALEVAKPVEIMGEAFSIDFATPQPVYHTKSAVKAIPADQSDFIAESQPVERRALEVAKPVEIMGEAFSIVEKPVDETKSVDFALDVRADAVTKPADPWAKIAATEKALEEKSVPEIKLEGSSLKDALTSLFADCAPEVYWEIDSAAVNEISISDMPIAPLEMKACTVSVALRRILRPLDLTYTINVDGDLSITIPENAKEMMLVRTYKVPTPEQFKDLQNNTPLLQSLAIETAESIKSVIPADWNASGKCRISPALDGSLMVRAPYEIHREIEKLLNEK